MSDERRKEPRFPVRVEAEVRFTSWHVFSLIYTINISKGGMNIELPDEPKKDAKLVVRLVEPDGNKVELSAVVRHAQQAKSGRWSVGVQFENIAPAQLEAIEKAIKAHGGTLQATGLTPRK
jgi:c-di-GMP-binding flagellar brake protein YcgR